MHFTVAVSLCQCVVVIFATDSGGQKLLFAFQFVGDRFKVKAVIFDFSIFIKAC